jgi:hypothetical protein
LLVDVVPKLELGNGYEHSPAAAGLNLISVHQVAYRRLLQLIKDCKEGLRPQTMATLLIRLWRQILAANEGLPAGARLRLHQTADYAELQEPLVGHYLRLDYADGAQIRLGRRTAGGRDLSVGEHLGVDEASGVCYLSVPRARPWSHGFDKVSLYVLDDRGIDQLLRNLMQDRPLQRGLELYKVRY